MGVLDGDPIQRRRVLDLPERAGRHARANLRLQTWPIVSEKIEQVEGGARANRWLRVHASIYHAARARCLVQLVGAAALRVCSRRPHAHMQRAV
jgi:hypothetical protein